MLSSMVSSTTCGEASILLMFFFFFKQKTAYERRISDCSSDVCSSDRGDLSENAEYHAAKERQGQVEATIGDLEDKLSRAQVIDPTTLSGDRIVFGATVTLADEDDKPVRYQIVGQAEADAKDGKISYNSPLGRALIGRRIDDEIEVTVPAGDKYYLVTKIEFI